MERSEEVVICETSYGAAIERVNRGERQLYCGPCRKWRWPEECAHEARLTGPQFRALLRQMRQKKGVVNRAWNGMNA